MARHDIPKKDMRPLKIITLDTETRGLEGEIFRLGFYAGKNKSGKDKYHVGNSFEEVKQQLLSYTITNNVHIFIHNLNFDLSKLIKELSGKIIWNESLWINNKPAIIKTLDFTLHDSMMLLGNASLEKLCKDFQIENAKKDMIEILWEQKHPCIQMKKVTPVTVYDKRKDKRYRIKKYFNPKDKQNINKRETMREYFNTVESLDPLLNEYLKYDCISLYEILQKITKVAPISLEDFLQCPTAASLSMKTFKKNFKDDYKKACSGIWQERNNQMEEVLKAGYYGGRTEVFIPFLKVRGYHFDVNSLYPYSMAKEGNHFPIGNARQIIGVRAAKFFEQYCRHKVGGGVIEATVYSPETGMIGEYPILPLKYDGKLIFPKGEFTGTWTYPELAFAMSRGVKIIQIHQVVHFFKTADLFTRFVNYFKKLKEDNTPNGDPEHDKKCNPSLRQLSKNILNSLYGKFATKRERDSYVGENEIRELLETLEKKNEYFKPEIQFFKDFLLNGEEKAQKNYFREHGDNRKIIGRMPIDIKSPWMSEKVFEYTTYLNSDYIQIQISAYVTSYARIELYLGFENIYNKDGKIYYCDTDSMVVDKPLDKSFIHSTEFGKWEQEGKKKLLREGIFYQPKTYMERYEVEQTPETAKFNQITMHTKRGTCTRWFNIAQEDVTKKFKGVDKETVSNMNMRDLEFFIARTKKRDVDKIDLITEKDNKKNLISVITAIKQQKDPNTMNIIKKSINVQTAVPKRKFDYDENKSTPWSVDPKHQDFLKPNNFDVDVYNRFMAEVADYNKFDLALEEYGKLKIPNKKDPQYEKYMELSVGVRRRYFSRNGGALKEEIADFVETHPDDLFNDMKWYFRGARKI